MYTLLSFIIVHYLKQYNELFGANGSFGASDRDYFLKVLSECLDNKNNSHFSSFSA